eukprot:12125550-Alexandrium_andersonii.AAC.1
MWRAGAQRARQLALRRALRPHGPQLPLGEAGALHRPVARLGPEGARAHHQLYPHDGRAQARL